MKSEAKKTKSKMVTALKDKEVLSIKETAEFLTLSTNTVRALIFTGEIKAKKMGQKYFILKSNIIDKLNEADDKYRPTKC